MTNYILHIKNYEENLEINLTKKKIVYHREPGKMKLLAIILKTMQMDGQIFLVKKNLFLC